MNDFINHCHIKDNCKEIKQALFIRMSLSCSACDLQEAANSTAEFLEFRKF